MSGGASEHGQGRTEGGGYGQDLEEEVGVVKRNTNDIRVCDEGRGCGQGIYEMG